MQPFSALLSQTAALVDERLKQILDQDLARGAPARLVEATLHACLGGGKRFRPFLVLQSANLFDISNKNSLDAACALECIHCYSLVHDDLPAMDNDELRRGQPTVWKAYDEWTAILVGDALQSIAFEVISAPQTHTDPTTRVELVRVLAAAAGPAGMVGGQALDLEAGKLASQKHQDAEKIARLQAMKTGRLISVACEIGAILGNATSTQRAALKHFGDCVGFAFQISDDLLDAEGQSEAVGKATGKDAAAGKATLVSLLGVERAREHLDKTVASAVAALEIFGDKAATLVEAAKFMGRRGF